MRHILLFILALLLLSACAVQPAQTEPSTLPADTAQPFLPNPASEYCQQQGHTLEIRTAEDGSQAGYCIFEDGSECDEWAYYRGECAPASQGGSIPNPASAYCMEQGYTSEIRTADDGSQGGVCIFSDGSECDEWAFFRRECKPGDAPVYDEFGWKIYTNPQLGYRFSYPPEAEIIINDEPMKSMMIMGEGLNGETWGIGHPADMDEYRPPEDVDLLQWLTDHNMLGEEQLPDEQIAGTTAVHFRHPASQQSTADDRYYFAHAGQLYMLLIGHGSETEDWELNDRFLRSFEFIELPSGTPTPIPTALPIDPQAYQDWQTYTNLDYNFTLRLPDDWMVEEMSDALLEGHGIMLRTMHQSQLQNIRLTFREAGDDTLLWPTGVGQGDFVPQETLEIAGQPVLRLLLVCPTGEVTSIHYQGGDDQPNIVRGKLEFAIIFSASNTHCQPGYSLSGEAQWIGEMIIASLRVQE